MNMCRIVLGITGLSLALLSGISASFSPMARNGYNDFDLTTVIVLATLSSFCRDFVAGWPESKDTGHMERWEDWKYNRWIRIAQQHRISTVRQDNIIRPKRITDRPKEQQALLRILFDRGPAGTLATWSTVAKSVLTISGAGAISGAIRQSDG